MMKKNIRVNKTISLSMMIMLGCVLANGAMADSQNKKTPIQRARDADSSAQHYLEILKSLHTPPTTEALAEKN